MEHVVGWADFDKGGQMYVEGSLGSGVVVECTTANFLTREKIMGGNFENS